MTTSMPISPLPQEGDKQQAQVEYLNSFYNFILMWKLKVKFEIQVSFSILS